MPDIPLAEQIATLRAVIADMETVRRANRTSSYECKIAAMKAVMATLLSIKPEGC